MPVMDGVAATREIIAGLPQTRIVMLTTFDDDAPIFAALRAGARGYLLKDVESDELTRAVRAVAAGEAFIQPRLTARVIDAFAANPRVEPTHRVGSPMHAPLPEPLTEREDEVLQLLAAGLANREIAERLVITEGTVKNHVSNILAKLGVRDRTQALLRAQALGLLHGGG
jgi:DNA-binding NarL/FixJ family response regulator